MSTLKAKPGEKTFRQIDSWERTGKDRLKKMQEVFLGAKLVEEAPWIDRKHTARTAAMRTSSSWRSSTRNS